MSKENCCHVNASAHSMPETHAQIKREDRQWLTETTSHKCSSL